MFRSSEKTQNLSSDASFIGADINIIGDIDSVQEIHLSGSVTGNLSSQTIVILDKGKVEGNITSDVAVISGDVSGDITTGQLSITSTARIRGTLCFADIEIEQGADVTGQFIKSEASLPVIDDKDDSSSDEKDD